MSGHLDGPRPPHLPGPPDPPYVPGDLGAPSREEFDRRRGVSAPDEEVVKLAFWECGHIEVDRGRSHACPLDVCSATYRAYLPVGASPDERLREALTADAIAAAVMEWDRWPCRATTDKRPAMRAAIAAALDTAALAAADREAPDEGWTPGCDDPEPLSPAPDDPKETTT